MTLKWSTIVVVAVIVGAALLVLAGLWLQQGSLVPPDPITVGGPLLEQSALVYIAEEQGFFAENGLDVTVRDDYGAGAEAVDALLAGDVDISVSTEYPVVAAVLEGAEISIVGSIDRSQTTVIVARRDLGINTVPDLAGRRVGVPRGTIAEFYLGRFLELQGMDLSSVILVDVPANGSVNAIAAGDVDAVVTWQPYAWEVEERLKDSAVVWPTQSSQLRYAAIAVRDDRIASHPDTVRRFLASLARAEAYLVDHPVEARGIVQDRMNLSDAYLAAVWPEHRFGLSLDQSLLTAMNDEGRWIIRNNLTSATALPELREHIDASALLAVKPEAVNLR